jgi:hypothetical protein
MTMEAGGGTALMRRATVAELVMKRNKALDLYRSSHTALIAAMEAGELAHEAHRALVGGINSLNYHIHTRGEVPEGVMLTLPGKVSPLDEHMKYATRLVDTDAWSYVVQVTDLERLMDKTAKEELRKSLVKEPPEFSEENVIATLESVRRDADMIFKRGMAVSFSKLERRFRTHDGWKVGSRVILDRVFDENGWWNYHRGHEDTMNDIERVFKVLDGKPFTVCDVNNALRTERGRGRGAHQSEIDTEYFKVRVFKNGNAHLWFKRDDLVSKVNKLIGEYYGNPIPEERGAAADDGGLYNPKTTLAKNYGFYPTRGKAVTDFFNKADISLYQPKSEPRLRILEPSAGTGDLARHCLTIPEGTTKWDHERQRFDHVVDCVEIQPELAQCLRNEGIFGKVFMLDFLAMTPDMTGLYDKVIMNPPFDRERDIDHVVHALKFLKSGGTLHAIMSANTEFRETRKSIAFRALIGRLRGNFRDMPHGSFSGVGTNVNTVALRVTKGRE